MVGVTLLFVKRMTLGFSGSLRPASQSTFFMTFGSASTTNTEHTTTRPRPFS